MPVSAQTTAIECWQAEELESARLQNFKLMLMAGALNCRTKVPAVLESYNGFIAGKRDFIVANQYIIRAHFMRQNGVAKGGDAYTSYETLLGNRFSAAEYGQARCEALGGYARFATTASDSDLPLLVRTVWRDAEAMPVCAAATPPPLAPVVATAAPATMVPVTAIPTTASATTQPVLVAAAGRTPATDTAALIARVRADAVRGPAMVAAAAQPTLKPAVLVGATAQPAVAIVPVPIVPVPIVPVPIVPVPIVPVPVAATKPVPVDAAQALADAARSLAAAAAAMQQARAVELVAVKP